MRTRNNLKRLGILLLGAFGLLLLQPSPVLAANQDHFSLSLGFEFSSGDYGTDQTTDSYRIPLTLDYAPNQKLDFELVIPYIHQSNGATIPLGGMRFSMQNSTVGSGSGSGGMDGGSGSGGMGSGSGSGGMGSGSGSAGTSVVSSAAASSGSQSGLGDLTLTVGYTLIDETRSSPLFRPLMYLKFPTADETRGLGTGAFDFGGGLSLAKTLGNWATYAEILYIAPGSSDTFDPDHYWSWQTSASYRFTERLSTGIGLSGATSAFAGGDAALQAKLTVDYMVSQRGSLGGYLAKGLTDGSADFGVGIFAAIGF